MRLLFRRPDGCSMKFHLAKFSDYDLKQYTKLITINGGEVEDNVKPNVLTFTPPIPFLEYEYVFDIKFIDDCIKFKKILDVDSYFIGDTRFYRGCPMTKLILQTSSCLLNQLSLYPRNEIIVTTFEDILIRSSQLMEETEVSISPSPAVSSETLLFNETKQGDENLETLQNETEIFNNTDDNLIANLDENQFENESTRNNENVINESLDENQIENESTRNNENVINESLDENQFENESTRNNENVINESLDENQIENESTRCNENVINESLDQNQFENEITRNKENVINKNIDENQFENEVTRNSENVLNKSSESNQERNEVMRNVEANSQKNSKKNPRKNKKKAIDNLVTTSMNIDETSYSDSLDNEKNHQGPYNIRIMTKKRLKEYFYKYKLEDWIEELNKDKAKDSDGYPKKYGRTYSSWETKNLVSLIIKTDCYELINSFGFWKYVEKLKIVDQSRTYKSMHKHMLLRVLPKIETFNMSNANKKKFIDFREHLKSTQGLNV